MSNIKEVSRQPQCNHKEVGCVSMEKQARVDYGKCLLRNPFDCTFEPKSEEVVQWCPQHGYPLPCHKRGMPKSNKREELCGAYAECWEELGKPEGWKGCSLPKGHEGNHTDKEKRKGASR